MIKSVLKCANEHVLSSFLNVLHRNVPFSRITAYVWTGFEALSPPPASCQHQPFAVTVEALVQILFPSVCGRDAANTFRFSPMYLLMSSDAERVFNEQVSNRIIKKKKEIKQLQSCQLRRHADNPVKADREPVWLGVTAADSPPLPTGGGSDQILTRSMRFLYSPSTGKYGREAEHAEGSHDVLPSIERETQAGKQHVLVCSARLVLERTPPDIT